MSSFLNKVFGRKKHDEANPEPARRQSRGSLLEGKFEVIPQIVAPNHEGAAVSKVREQSTDGKTSDAGLASLFRSRSRPAPGATPADRTSEPPSLTLNLPRLKDEADTKDLSAVFETDPTGRFLLEDAAIAALRLDPQQTVLLVRACSQAILTRGLDTLGIMHPNWYSTSPDVQRKIISLFIHSLASNGPSTTLSTSSSSPSAAFESEVNSARSPHDVAAVLRWGLRHLKLDGSSFGRDPSWYKSFLESERSTSWPPKAYTDALIPQLPPVHAELLHSTLDILSSLAAHGDNNGSSGSKMTKLLGLWLLEVQRVSVNDDMLTFYSRWERAGRIFEHIFLSRIRDESVAHRVPTRLLELVNHYPYTKDGADSDGLLSRPRLSTRQYTALFVRIEAELPADSKSVPKPHPLRLISDAFRAEVSGTPQEHDAWEQIKSSAMANGDTVDDEHDVASRVFSDDTVRLLSRASGLPGTGSRSLKAPTITVTTPVPEPGRKRSFSLGDATPGVSNGSPAKRKPSENPPSSFAHPKFATSAAPDAASADPQSQNGVYTVDWAQFSTTGFGEDKQLLASTLMDKDVEVTEPPPVRKVSRQRKSHSRRSSVDNPVVVPAPEPVRLVSKTTEATMIQIDEAFVDFWSDAIVDPISADFPPFVICRLKTDSPASAPGSPISATYHADKPVSWLVIEQKFTRPAPPAQPATQQAGAPPPKGRATSPRPSFRSDISSPFKMSSTLSATRKRFSFLSNNRSSTATATATERQKPRKTSHDVRVGEMGEIVREEGEPAQAAKKPRTEKGEAGNGKSPASPAVAQPPHDNSAGAGNGAVSPDAIAEAKPEVCPPQPEAAVPEEPSPQEVEAATAAAAAIIGGVSLKEMAKVPSPDSQNAPEAAPAADGSEALSTESVPATAATPEPTPAVTAEPELKPVPAETSEPQETPAASSIPATTDAAEPTSEDTTVGPDTDTPEPIAQNGSAAHAVEQTTSEPVADEPSKDPGEATGHDIPEVSTEAEPLPPAITEPEAAAAEPIHEESQSTEVHVDEPEPQLTEQADEIPVEPIGLSSSVPQSQEPPSAEEPDVPESAAPEVSSAEQQTPLDSGVSEPIPIPTSHYDQPENKEVSTDPPVDAETHTSNPDATATDEARETAPVIPPSGSNAPETPKASADAEVAPEPEATEPSVAAEPPSETLEEGHTETKAVEQPETTGEGHDAPADS